MRNKLSCLSLIMLPLACLPAIAQNSGAQSIPQDSHPSTQNPSAADTATPSKVTNSDQRFLLDLARANQAAILADQVAEMRAVDNDVKRLAQQMIKDHTSTQGKLITLAQKKQVVLPLDITKDQTNLLSKLRLLPGSEFDSAYVDLAGNKEHMNMLDLLQRIQQDAQDGDLKMLARELQPIEEAHLKQAREVGGKEMSERR